MGGKKKKKKELLSGALYRVTRVVALVNVARFFGAPSVDNSRSKCFTSSVLVFADSEVKSANTKVDGWVFS